MDMFGIVIAIGIGIETEWSTSKPIPNPNPIPMTPQRSNGQQSTHRNEILTVAQVLLDFLAARRSIASRVTL